MATSDRSFNQVKAILGKLDRSIDEARERRTQPHEASPEALAAPRPAEVRPATPASAPVAIAPPAPQTPAAIKGAAFGRAKPLRPSNGTTPPPSALWRN